MSNAISIPSQSSTHVTASHLDMYSKTFSGQSKVRGVRGDKGRHTSGGRHYDLTEEDSDGEDPAEHHDQVI